MGAQRRGVLLLTAAVALAACSGSGGQGLPPGAQRSSTFAASAPSSSTTTTTGRTPSASASTLPRRTAPPPTAPTTLPPSLPPTVPPPTVPPTPPPTVPPPTVRPTAPATTSPAFSAAATYVVQLRSDAGATGEATIEIGPPQHVDGPVAPGWSPPGACPLDVAADAVLPVAINVRNTTAGADADLELKLDRYRDVASPFNADRSHTVYGDIRYSDGTSECPGSGDDAVVLRAAWPSTPSGASRQTRFWFVVTGYFAGGRANPSVLSLVPLAPDHSSFLTFRPVAVTGPNVVTAGPNQVFTLDGSAPATK